MTTHGRKSSVQAREERCWALPVSALPSTGRRDRMSCSGPTRRMVPAIEPEFLAGVVDETAHLVDVKLRPTWTVEDRHIIGVMRGSACGPRSGITGGSSRWPVVGGGPSHDLIRRYAIRNTGEPNFRSGTPAARRNRVMDFMRQNYATKRRLWELAQLAGMHPADFCELLK
jgi:hypothetical protein